MVPIQAAVLNAAASVADVKALYYIMQSMEGKLGGGEGIEGLYGSITRSGMQKILDSLAQHSSLSNSSHIVDVGAGLGRPLLHALVSPGVASGFGIEIDQIKCNKAAAFLEHSVKQLAQRASRKSVCVPKIRCSSIEKIASLDPATHAYSFWEGVPVEGKCAFGSLFSTSKSLQSVAVVQRAMRGRTPAAEMEEMGFGKLHLVDFFSVSMSGSGRSFTAYVFNKAGTQPSKHQDPLQPATPALPADKRQTQDTEDPDSDARLHSSRDEPPSEAGDTPATKTPLTQDKASSPASKPHSAAKRTPKSIGVSGRPRRVVTTQGLQELGNRRSRRLMEQKSSELVKSPSKPTRPTTGVQKPKSPVKLNLEAAGFRVVRGRPNAASKPAKLPMQKPTIKAKGLAMGRDSE